MKDAIKHRDDSEVGAEVIVNTLPTSFLHLSYKPSHWYWESVETVRRVAFTGGLVLVAQGTSIQIVIALCAVLVFMKLYAYCQPFVDHVIATDAEIAQHQLFFVLMMSLVLKEDMISDFDNRVDMMLNVCLFMFVIPTVIRFILDWVCRFSSRKKWMQTGTKAGLPLHNSSGSSSPQINGKKQNKPTGANDNAENFASPDSSRKSQKSSNSRKSNGSNSTESPALDPGITEAPGSGPELNPDRRSELQAPVHDVHEGDESKADPQLDQKYHPIERQKTSTKQRPGVHLAPIKRSPKQSARSPGSASARPTPAARSPPPCYLKFDKQTGKFVACAESVDV